MITVAEPLHVYLHEHHAMPTFGHAGREERGIQLKGKRGWVWFCPSPALSHSLEEKREEKWEEKWRNDARHGRAEGPAAVAPIAQ